MSEAMTVETIIEADWLMRGFWTKVRYPLRTSRGGWSDIDVLAYNPKTRELIIAESKVQGPKRAVYAYTSATKKKFGDILQYDKDKNNYFRFLRHINRAFDNGVIFSDFPKMVKKVTIQLVSNYFIARDVMPDAEKTVWEKVRKDVPKSVELHVCLETTLDVIARIISSENKNKQGRRYGHPVIDVAREINRYMHPEIRSAGRGKAAIAPIRKELSEILAQAIGALR